jgi:hypothetical protein
MRKVKDNAMIDNGGITLWEIARTIVSLAWIPLGVWMNFRNNKVSKDTQWQASIEQRLNASEALDKVHIIQIDAMKDTAKEMKESIKEVKQGIDKLIDRLIK